LPGDVPVVLEAPAPLVPEVLELAPAPDVLELLLAPEVPLPDMLPLVPVPLVDDELSAGGVVEPETEVLLLLGVEGVVVSVEDDELLTGGVAGVTVVEDEELAGVEPVLPVLLQPVAATEASAMTATRGIRRFMTSSPIWFTCVEDKVSAGFAAWARSDRHAPPRRATTDHPRTSRATAYSGRQGRRR